MMKQFIFTGALILASAMPGEVMAQCVAGGTWTRVTNLVETLTDPTRTAQLPGLGMTACDATATYNNTIKYPGQGPVVMGIQEEHHYGSGTGGDLWDYKCGDTDVATGPGTPCEKPDTDRRKKVGTWNVDRNNDSRATVTYTYTDTGAGPALRVFTDGTVYDFCNGSTSVGTITLKPTTLGTRACP
jgi:hypothetical protein